VECFRDFSTTNAFGYGPTPALESTPSFRRSPVVGILLAALYQPIWTSAIDSAKSLALALILFAGLQIWKIAPWILVVIGAVVGGIIL
jgi:hypothetical protein